MWIYWFDINVEDEEKGKLFGGGKILHKHKTYMKI